VIAIMRIRSAAALVLVTATTLTLAACSGRPENSPAIRKKFAEVDTLKESIDKLTAQVELVGADVRRLSEENGELRAFIPTDGSGTPALDKLTTLESRLNQLEGLTAGKVLANTTTKKAPAAGAPEVAAAPAKTGDLATAPIAGAPAPVAAAPAQASKKAVVANQQEVKPAKEVAQKSTTKPGFKQMTSTKPAAPAAAPASRGTYHVIEPGDTVQTIAAKNNITADQLLEANRLPAGVRLAKGQRLFVPAK